jgi:hypothetical protein
MPEYRIVTDASVEPAGFNVKKFLKHYKEELRDQFRGLTKK